MSYSVKNNSGFFILFAAFIVIFIQSLAYGAVGHNNPSQLLEFRINNVDVTFGIEPPTFQKGVKPKVFISLKDTVSDSAVFDAHISIYIKKSKPQGNEKQLTEVSPAQISDSGGLDFGDTDIPASGGNVIDISAFTKMEQLQMAGMYVAPYSIDEAGTYRFTLAVKRLQGKKYEDPLIYGGNISYQERSNVSLYRILAIIGFIIISGIIGVWIMIQRRNLKLKTSQKMNLLDVPWISKFIRSSWYPPVFQVPTFIIFLVIIIAGLFDVQTGNKNIATLLTWTIWWAAIIFTFVFVGRIWCMACPIGVLQDWIVRVKTLNRNFPKTLRNIYLSSLLFFALTWWDSYSGIVNRPDLTAYLLISFFIVAAGMAFIYKGRSFCRYVCPIGGLIGLYSMFSPIELRNTCLEVCRNHKVKECIKGTESSYPCPMFETPMTLDRNNYCNFCSECIKSCSQNNIVVRFRSFAKDIWVSSKGYLDEALLAVGLVGMTIVVTGEMVAPWQDWMNFIGKMIPFDLLGIKDHVLIEKVTFSFVLIVSTLLLPSLLLILASLIVRKNTGPDSPLSLKSTFIQFAYMFIPIGLATHLSHNINHLLLEGPSVIPAVQSLIYRLSGSLSEPNWAVVPLMGSESIFWLQMLIIVIMNVFSLYAGYRISTRFYGEKAVRAFIPMAVLAICFMVINAYILGQPMAMRHTH